MIAFPVKLIIRLHSPLTSDAIEFRVRCETEEILNFTVPHFVKTAVKLDMIIDIREERD